MHFSRVSVLFIVTIFLLLLLLFICCLFVCETFSEGCQQLFVHFVLFWLRRIVRNKAAEKAKGQMPQGMTNANTNATPVITQAPASLPGQPIGYSITGILGIPNAAVPTGITVTPTSTDPNANKRKREDAGKFILYCPYYNVTFKVVQENSTLYLRVSVAKLL